MVRVSMGVDCLSICESQAIALSINTHRTRLSRRESSFPILNNPSGVENTMVQAITSKNFKAKLATALKQDGTLRDNLQRLVIFGMLEYDINHNSNWLSDIMNAGFKGVRMAAIQEYIQDHTDLIFSKKKDSDPVFLREALAGWEFKLPEVTWYEYSNKGEAVPVANIEQMMRTIKGYIVKIEKGLKGEDTELKGDKKVAEDFLKKLQTIAA